MSKNFRGGKYILIISNIISFLLLIFVFIKGDVHRKILSRFKIIESPDYYAIFSWTNMLNKMRYDSDIVFFGDSITRGSDFQEYFPNVRIVNLGYSGDDLVRSLRRINQIKALMPEKIFLLIGINGLGTKSDIDFKSEYMTLVDSIIQCMPSSELYLQSILPVNEFKKDKSVANNQKISNANQIIQGISKEKGLIYIDLFSLFSHTGGLPDSLTVDGVHLLPSAYQIWAREISGYVEN